MYQFDTVNHVEDTLQQQFQDIVDDAYTCSIWDQYTDHTIYSFLGLLTHVYA